MTRIATVFHNQETARRMEDRLRRHAGSFDTVYFHAEPADEGPLGPGVSLTQAVLTAAETGPAAPSEREDDVPVRERLESLGMGTHRADWYLKQVLHGYAVAVYTFPDGDGLRKALSLLERSDTVAVERLTTDL